MIKTLLYMTLLLFFSAYQLYSQEDGVVALELPVRNSLKFNRFVVNPTFSFVKEDYRYVSFTNKRQWMQFDDAPQTYLFSYSGKVRENIGAGIALFQQDYGVLTTFGGVLNFAYNVTLNNESNLTFGMNLGFYKSGLNEGKVVTNFPDPSLDDIPSNFIFTVNPGINYGTTFFDFGLSINNAVAYNLKTSEMIEDNPEQSLQAHIMYTGYMNARGFFDQSKFSTLLRSEFKKDKTVISGVAMVSVPKGIWAQAGYNTLYGISAGIGLNITKQIAIEYNYENAVGDLSDLGNSHEFTLAYRFKKTERRSYFDDNEEQALFTPSRRSRRVLASQAPKRKPRPTTTSTPVVTNEVETDTPAIVTNEIENNNNTNQAEEERAIAEQETQEKLAEETRLKEEAEAQQKQEEEARIKAQQEEQDRLAEEARVKAEQEAQEKLEEEAKLAEQVAQAKAEEEARIRMEEMDEVVLNAQGDKNAKSMNDIIKLTEDSKIEQQDLLIKLREKVAVKQQDLDDLKEENDLSEQGIFLEHKPFKSLSAENRAIAALQIDLDNLIKSQELKIAELERLYNDRLKEIPENDSVNQFYSRKIQELKSEQLQAIQTKTSLTTSLETIEVATEVERKRRIRRAAYNNEQDRYQKDRATLNYIKQNTPVSNTPLKPENFDSGEVLDNIQIIKGVNNIEKGYYVVIAVHTDIEKRDEFLRKAVAAGQENIDFFFDVNTSKYYIYYEKFDSLNTANQALQAKGSQPYNNNMSMVKIEE
ncbi:MAG TPA: PorP/SprF family type IX secretion system membrane protein [Flavobacteriaceae bacterium]|nr:PorP/SprF family type IX secretion system membrane protein [Flavobacteriaceae bacterium]